MVEMMSYYFNVQTLPLHALQKLKKTQGVFVNNGSAAGLALALFTASSAESTWHECVSTNHVSARITRIAPLLQHSPVGLHLHEDSILLICISLMAVDFCHLSSIVSLFFCRPQPNSTGCDASLMPRVLCNCYSVFGPILLLMLHCHTLHF